MAGDKFRPLPPIKNLSGEQSLAAGAVWDLGDLYQGPEDPGMRTVMEDGLAAAQRFSTAYRGEVASRKLRGEALAGALREMEEILLRAQRPSFYSSLLVAANTQSSEALDLSQRTREAFIETRNELIFFDLELIALTSKDFENLLKDPAIAPYRHYLTHLRSFSPHTLAEREEQIINKKDLAGESAFSELYEQLAGSLRFRFELDGEAKELTEEELLALLEQPDPQLRRHALITRFETYGAHSLIFTSIFNAVLLNHRIEGEIRSYPHPMSPAHLENEVERGTVQAMLDSVKAHYPMIQEYFRIKARLLGLPKLANSDLAAPLPKANRQPIEYASAKQLVLDAFNGFCPVFAEIAQDFFNRGWIDAEVRAGKSPGAFCAAFDPDQHPYLLLSYTGTSGDVATLAHELGHGIHYCLAKKQTYFNYDAPLVMAETASVFAELLVAYQLLATAPDSALRRQILCDTLDNIYGTVFRQCALTRFEAAAHKRCERGRLSEPLLNKLWREEQLALFEDTVDLVPKSEMGWSCVSHFFWHCFYCYSYSFGQLLVLALFQRYQEQGGGFVKQYLQLLETGGGRSPGELMARLGFDITNREFWSLGFKVIDNLITEINS